MRRPNSKTAKKMQKSVSVKNGQAPKEKIILPVKRPNRLPSRRRSIPNVDPSIASKSGWLDKLSKKIAETESQIEQNQSISNFSFHSKSGGKSFLQSSAKQAPIRSNDNKQVVILYCSSSIDLRIGPSLLLKLLKNEKASKDIKVALISMKGKSKRQEVYIIETGDTIDLSKDPSVYKHQLVWEKTDNKKLSKSNVDLVHKLIVNKLG
jgi:hypothetical protein